MSRFGLGMVALCLLSSCGSPLSSRPAPPSPPAPVPAPAPAPALGDSFNNGGGNIEQLVTYAWLNLKRFASLCLEAAPCLPEAADRAVLARARDLWRADGLRFVHGASEAVTVGPQISVDASRLAKDVGLPRLVGLLSGALTRLSGEQNARAERLDSLIERFFSRRIERVTFARFGHPEIEISGLGEGLLLRDATGLRDLGEFFLIHFRCPEGDEAPLGASFHHVFPWGLRGTTVTVVGDSTHIRCASGAWRGRTRFSLAFTVRDHLWTWNADRSRIDTENIDGTR